MSTQIRHVESNRHLPWVWPRAAYLHVPFCAHHCCYCDFAIAVGQDHLADQYVEAMERELATLGEPQPVETLFLGGGTPTHLTTPQLQRLLQAVRHWLPPRAGYEWSIEANPTTLTEEKVAMLAEQGVTRISLGVQSLNRQQLRTLERDHVPADVTRAVERTKRHGLQVSLDLIFGTPGQTVAAWEADLREAIALEPDHLSTYGLTYEKGTPLWKQRERGEVFPLEEETELALYATALDTLEAAGFAYYEISNAARPGGRCRHNEVYWANHAYFGFGMGAARYVEGRRELNTRDLHTYLRKTLAGEGATFQSERLEGLERAQETLAVQLRRREGIDRAAFATQTGYTLDAVAGSAIEYLVAAGLLNATGTHVQLTRSGMYVADSVAERLLR